MGGGPEKKGDKICIKINPQNYYRPLPGVDKEVLQCVREVYIMMGDLVWTNDTRRQKPSDINTNIGTCEACLECGLSRRALRQRSRRNVRCPCVVPPSGRFCTGMQDTAGEARVVTRPSKLSWGGGGFVADLMSNVSHNSTNRGR